MSFSDDELERYARHIVLKGFGAAGQARLKAAHVAIVGAGGIGSPALLYLVAAGVGRVTIIDDDSVSLSNLHRQIAFDTGQQGTGKVDAAAARAAALNPHVAITPVAARIDRDTAADLLRGADIVLDGSDNFATRLAVADTALMLRIALVSAAIGQFHGQVATWRGWEADQPCYRCFVGDAHDPDDCDDCSTVGVLGPMVGWIGSFAAVETVRAITGFGEPAAGKLHIIDGLAPAMRTIRMPKDAGCQWCGSPVSG